MAIRALVFDVFDVFGTLVDWRSGVAREAGRILGPALEAGAFADAWRARYQPSLEQVRTGRRPWADLDTLHAESLEDILAQFGIVGLGPDAKCDLVLAWHRLDAWPETSDALTRLSRNYWLAPLSNAHVRLMVSLARRNGWSFDAVFGGEFSQDYKPKAALYHDAVAAFGFEARETLMVAAHSSDLAAAASFGLATAHIARPLEYGPSGGETAPSIATTYAASDLADLARQLGC